MKIIVLCLLIFSLLFFVSCAPGPNPCRDERDDNGDIAGFWKGLWHALIMLFTFIGSWFSNNVNIYEVHNNGFWYHLGLFFPGLFFGFVMAINSIRFMKSIGLWPL